jgi:hypothetical protein
MCHNTGTIFAVASAPAKIIIAVVATKIIKPYIVNRWESLRLGFSNSDEVRTSLVTV